MNRNRVISTCMAVFFYAVPILLPLFQPQPDPILTKGFTFGIIPPYAWWCIIFTIVYIPVPFFIMCWVTVLDFCRARGLVISGGIMGLIRLWQAQDQYADHPEVRRSFSMVGISMLYGFLVLTGWITYCVMRGM